MAFSRRIEDVLSITAWCFLYVPPKNIRKIEGFLMFSGGIDKQHSAVIG